MRLDYGKRVHHVADTRAAGAEFKSAEEHLNSLAKYAR